MKKYHLIHYSNTHFAKISSPLVTKNHDYYMLSYMTNYIEFILYNYGARFFHMKNLHLFFIFLFCQLKYSYFLMVLLNILLN